MARPRGRRPRGGARRRAARRVAGRARHRDRPRRTGGGRLGRALPAPARRAGLGGRGAARRGPARPPPRRRHGRAPAPDRAAAGRLPVGPRADRGAPSFRTRSRRPTRSPRPSAGATPPSWSTSWATCSSRRSSSRCSARRTARATCRGRGRDHREAHPPPPARLRRARGRDGRRGAPQLGADQARRRGPGRHLPRRPRACCRRCFMPARCSGGRRLSASTGTPGTAPGPASSRSSPSFARRSMPRRRRVPSTSPTPTSSPRRAISSSPPSTWRGWPTSIPSSRCGPPRAGSASRVEEAERLAAEAGETWTELDLDAQDAWYRRAKEALHRA